jgi:hypothetical protein
MMPVHSRTKSHSIICCAAEVDARIPSRLNRSAILPWSEHEVRDARRQNRLTPLGVIERIDQRERLIVLVSERANRPAFERVAGGLSG